MILHHFVVRLAAASESYGHMKPYSVKKEIKLWFQSKLFRESVEIFGKNGHYEKGHFFLE